MKSYWSSSSFFFLAVVSLVIFILDGPACNFSWSPLTWNVGFLLGSDQVLEQKQVPQVDKVVRRYSKLEKLEAGLVRARSSIREDALIRNSTSTHRDPDYVPQGSIYTNANAFHSVVKLVEYLYVPGDYRIPGIERTVVDYINTVSTKYPFWNRSLGADHFMLACHDWACKSYVIRIQILLAKPLTGPGTSKFVPNLFNKSIRVLCNANTSEGFNSSKDVTLPGLYLTGKLEGLLGGLSQSHRSILAFFSGGEHGHIRSLLFHHWKNSTDPDIQVHEYLPAGVSYNSMIQKSKFCLCPSGHEVGSPRIVEAIYAGCVPVIIKDGYVPPFSDVLNWKTFSVKVEVKEYQI
ncbi:hypothetical protein LWI28_028281 [Acer negundo]|uniref:Exostosin GT47 domain-containing protein n=1 Tax=Acer negundo TaxID=4023 RepID=A0AAD5IY51_ACENE|nr:hypothetical protein LWI28_028281 [Acer negundo]